MKGTLIYGLRLGVSVSNDVHAFSDSDWAVCPVGRKSTSGFFVFLGSNLVSKVSSTEAEYKGFVDISIEVTWVVSLLRELGLHSSHPHSLWCDNLGATYFCANLVFYIRTKYVEIDYHFVWDKVAFGEL